MTPRKAPQARQRVSSEVPRVNVRTTTLRVAVVLLALGGGACGGIADEGKLPPGIQDPATLRTPSGAMARYRGVLTELPGTFDTLLTEIGILTDELADLPAPLGVEGRYTHIDARDLHLAFEPEYDQLHKLRAQAREARGFLQSFAPDSSPALAGHMYAIEGYAELLLADLFCSGIPLSTVDFDGDFTLTSGFSTADVYRHAIALFDSAGPLVGDSLWIQQFTAIARGRALLALGRYAEAATAVAGVPDDYKYQVVFTPAAPTIPLPGPDRSLRLLESFQDKEGAPSGRGYKALPATPSVGHNEGGNGLDYRGGDPRVLVIDTLGDDVLGQQYYFPAKYARIGSATLTIANGIEARLIEAEAALQIGDPAWLAKLNALRTDGTQDGGGNYNPGTGGVAGLAPLSDPGAAPARVDLLFRERAFWLYLTGHRQGDLRRLVRDYLRPAETVYPTGHYPGGAGTYGADIVAPVPESERNLNAKYTGCIHLNA